MRADAFLTAAEALPFASLHQIAGSRGIVVIAPHPDDESLGCGGLIAAACAKGLPVELIVVSDGAGSHPNSPSYPPERLRALREQETLDAARVLGVTSAHVSFLRLSDRFVPASGPEAGAAAEAIADKARRCDAGTLFVTWAHDPHCDHAASSAIARLAVRQVPYARLMEYPVWGWSLPPDTEVGQEPRGVRLDIACHVASKHAAVTSHRSQTVGLIHDDPSGFRLDAEMLARFTRPFEIFLEVV